jgi:hypothetical protein
MKNEIINLENLTTNSLPELKGWREKQEQIVKDNPFISIEDSKSYEEAKKRRTNLVSARTTIEGQDKLIASKLSKFRKEVKAVSDELIIITKPLEEKQQAEVKRYEAIKEQEKAEKELLESKRIESIKSKLDELENASLSIVQKLIFDNIEISRNNLDDVFKIDFDFEEFITLLDMLENRQKGIFENRVSELLEKEVFRKNQEKLEEQLKESKRKEKEAEDKLEDERAKAKEKADKELTELFEIKKNRLLEIGFTLEDNWFKSKETILEINKKVVFRSSPLEFETILNDSKNEILVSKEEVVKEQKAKEEETRLKAKKEKANKERVKKLKSDKSHLEIAIKGISFNAIEGDLENKEALEFYRTFIGRLEEFIQSELNNLKNL